MRGPALGYTGLVLLLPLVTPGGTWAGAGEGLSEPEIERILSEGRITRRQEVGSGYSRPLRVWLKLDERSISACYKDIDDRRPGVTRFRDGRRELNFADSYKYERAAYLLDRRLGLDMVPVSVLRELWGREGALTLWIEDAISDQERRARALRPPDPERLVHQQADMRLFDALIFNTDRHPSNQLLTLTDWRLHLIDHSRSFRVIEELPEAFASRPVTLSRPMLESLESLTEGELSRLFRGVLTRREVRTLLARRDLILSKIGRDRRDYGDAFVFREQEGKPSTPGNLDSNLIDSVLALHLQPGRAGRFAGFHFEAAIHHFQISADLLVHPESRIASIRS